VGLAVSIGAAEADVSEHAVVQSHQGAAFATYRQGFGDAAEEAGSGRAGASVGGVVGGGEGAHDHLVIVFCAGGKAGWLYGWLWYFNCRRVAVKLCS
jgi:hypothetical protein